MARDPHRPQDRQQRSQVPRRVRHGQCRLVPDYDDQLKSGPFRVWEPEQRVATRMRNGRQCAIAMRHRHANRMKAFARVQDSLLEDAVSFPCTARAVFVRDPRLQGRRPGLAPTRFHQAYVGERKGDGVKTNRGSNADPSAGRSLRGSPLAEACCSRCSGCWGLPPA